MEQVTQAASQLGQSHSNEVVPHKISNHDLLVQAQIWAGKDVGWLNLNDTQDQLNMKLDLHKVEKVVQGQVELISGVRSDANAAVSQAESAQKASNVNQAAIGVMDSAQKATQQEVDDAVKQISNHDKSLTEINSALTAAQSDIATQSTVVATVQTDLSAAKQQIKDANGNITAINQTAQSAYAIASDANSNAAEAKLTASDISTTVSGLSNQVDSLSDATKAVSDAMKSKADAGQVNQVVSQLTTSVNQTKDALTSKADKLDIDKLTKTVTDTNDTLTQRADQLSNTINQVSNTAGKNSTAISNLTQTVDGLQTTVKNKADQSMISQLSNQILEKVSSKDYQAEIALLTKDLNLRVSKDDLISQINLEAGGPGLIQVENGKGKLLLDADSVIFGKDSKAFIPAALITNLTADQITTGTLKSIQIDNGDGKFTVNSNGDVVANSIKLRNGQFLQGTIAQGTIAGSTIYALNNDGVQDPKLAPKSDWYKITPNMIRWFNHYDQSVGQIGVGQGVRVEGPSEFTGTPGLTISDSAKILLGTAQRTVVTGDEIGNLETTGLDWMSKTNLEIKPDGLQVNLDPDQGTKYDGKGAEFVIQKDNKIGAYFGSGDNGDKLSITAAGITFNTALFSVCGEVHIPDHGLTVKALHVTSWLGVDGYKNTIVRTSQGTVAINAYETAEYYFGDIGENQTNGDGKVWVSIDYLFGQTVNTSVPYQVFVTPYSSAHVWVSKRLKNRFLVESDKPNASFAWEIKAKRKGYEHTRLKNVDNMMEKPAGVK